MRSLARDFAASKVKRRERRAARCPFTQSQPYEVSRLRLLCKERQHAAKVHETPHKITGQQQRWQPEESQPKRRRIWTRMRSRLKANPTLRPQSQSTLTHLTRVKPIDANTFASREVIIKLLLFTFAMIILPIGSYFVTLNTIYGGEPSCHHTQHCSRICPLTSTGNSTWAGATAAVMANVVLLGYVVVAMKEDQSDRLEAEEKERTKKSL